MAPAEKFGASLPTTSAAKLAEASLHAGVEHLDGVAADGVHLGVELDREDAVADVEEAGPGVARHDPLPVPCGFGTSVDLGRGSRR